MKTLKYEPTELRDLYLEWVNDYLTIECFADHRGISDDEARAVIDAGREIHEEAVRVHKAVTKA